METQKIVFMNLYDLEPYVTGAFEHIIPFFGDNL